MPIEDSTSINQYIHLPFMKLGWIAIFNNIAGKGFIDRSEPLQSKAVYLAI